jgi:hypothetical protein
MEPIVLFFFFIFYIVVYVTLLFTYTYFKHNSSDVLWAEENIQFYFQLGF